MAGTVEGAAGPRRGCGRGGASPWRRGRAGLLVCALAALSLQGRPAAAQVEDDVSASYDYDGTLLLDSRNFRGMTQQGVWVVMFYSYSVVIKSTEEAQHCQRFTWLWGDLANRYSRMGGETRGGTGAPCACACCGCPVRQQHLRRRRARADRGWSQAQRRRYTSPSTTRRARASAATCRP
jgi:hypothetical protein